MDIVGRWKAYASGIPDTQTILRASIENRRLATVSDAEVRTRFCDHLEGLMAEGLRLLRLYQEQQLALFVRDIFSTELPKLLPSVEREVVRSGPPSLVAQQIVAAVAAEVSSIPGELLSVPHKSIDQQTKKRAGVHMERAMAFLFGRAGLPFEQQKPKKSDFVFPNLDVWESTPELAVLVSAKHTLAERWKQLTTERVETGRNAYLVTLDDLQQDKAMKLVRHGFTLYLRPAVFTGLRHHPKIRDLNLLPSMIAKVINSP